MLCWNCLLSFLFVFFCVLFPQDASVERLRPGSQVAGKSFSLTYVFHLCFCTKDWDINGNGLIDNNRKWKDCVCSRKIMVCKPQKRFICKRKRMPSLQFSAIRWSLQSLKKLHLQGDIREIFCNKIKQWLLIEKRMGEKTCRKTQWKYKQYKI